MKILYSGASGPNQAQADPIKSLGKYPSITEVENRIGNLFGDLSKYLIDLNKPEYRAIVIHNNNAQSLSNLKVYFENADTDSDSDFEASNSCSFEIGYVTLTTDSCGDIIFPYSTTSPFNTPPGITFHSQVINVDNALQLPNLEPDQMLGIWIKRTIKSSTRQPLTDEEYIDILDGAVVLPTQEDLDLTFEWD